MQNSWKKIQSSNIKPKTYKLIFNKKGNHTYIYEICQMNQIIWIVSDGSVQFVKQQQQTYSHCKHNQHCIIWALENNGNENNENVNSTIVLSDCEKQNLKIN